MRHLMLHDIRDIDLDFFPSRYKFPYFYTNKEFKQLLKNFEPTSFDQEDDSKYIYTFDDGLIDHLNVAKLFFEKSIKAIFFVPSAPIVKREMICSHKIQFVLASAREEIILSKLLNTISKEFDIEDGYLEQFRKSRWENNIWSDEMVFITRILREFKTSSERNHLLNDLFSKFVSSDEKDFANNFYLSLQQVKEISEMGHLIGGHGNKSKDLLYCTNPEINDEILISNEFISQFNSELKVYAYANGGFNDYAIELLNALNFKKAFTTNLDNQGFSSLEQYFCKRLDPSI